MIHFQEISIGSGPRPRCRRCGKTSAVSAAAAFVDVEDLLPEIAKRVRECAGTPGPNLVLTGAEPFAHPALPRLISEAVAAGAERVALVTDGGALGVGQNAAGVLHAGVRHISIASIGLGTAADDRAGRLGLSERVVAGLRAIRDAAAAAGVTTAVSAEVAVCRHALGDLSATVAAFAEVGVGCVRLVPALRAAPLPVSAASVLAAACDTGAVNGVWVEVFGMPLPGSHAMHRARGAGAA